MKIVAQSYGELYLLCDDPEAAAKDLGARGEMFHAATGERHLARVHNALKHGDWERWDGKPVPGLPESQPGAAATS